MSMNRSQGVRKRRGGGRRLTAAVLCALSCLGDLPPRLPATIAQDTPAVAPGTDAPQNEPTSGKNPTNGATKSPAKGDLDSLLARKGTLNIRSGSLADWMLAIQKTWNVDILYDDVALQREQFTGNLTDTSLKQILDTVLSAKNYTYRRSGNALLIEPMDESSNAPRPDQKMELIEMEHLVPTDIEPSLKFLLSKDGKVQSIPSSKTMMVIDYENEIAAVREYIQKLDERTGKILEKAAAQNVLPGVPSSESGLPLVEQTVTTVLWPRFVLADNILEAVQSQLGDGTVTSVADMNALVVSGSESAVKQAAQVVKELDVIQKQVRISVFMYDIRVDALEQLGVNWRNAGKGRISANGIPLSLADLDSSPMPLGTVSSTTTGSSSSASTSTGTTGTTGAASASTGLGLGSFVTSATPNLVGSALTLRHLSRHFDLSAVILALHQTDGARLLARPSVTCYNRKESEIKIISEIPVQQLTQTDMGGTIGTTTFREAGVSLKVTPSIGNGTQIMLMLTPEFSVLTGFQAGQPIIDRRTLNQTVAVESGETIVLGGLRRRNELETVAGIPGLMNMKYLGNLFRSHRTTVEESELITFIHTEIIEPDYQGLLREQVAERVVNETLDRIPIAGHSPYVPPCNDPYCPIHNPQPKYWPGNMLGPNFVTGMQPFGDNPYHGYETLPPAPGQPIDSAPPATTSPDDSPLPPAPQSDPSASSPSNPTPPPVMIDENARRSPGTRTAIRRLPAINAQPNSQRLPAPATPARAPTRVANRPSESPAPPAPKRGFWQEVFR